jgi:Na+-transporting NADH:ubiquinone oxidoreductase subunit F
VPLAAPNAFRRLRRSSLEARVTGSLPILAAADFALVAIAVGISAGLCLALAALLVVAERYLVNYGPCKIDINSGAKELEVRGGDTLLASLMGEGIFIPSACGGRGTCEYCKVKVLDGAGPVGPTEAPLLTETDKKTGVRLSCQVKVRNDVKIEIPEQYFLVKQFRGRVERIRDLTHDIKELRIRLLEPDEIRFTAGQYVQLQTPAYGDNPEPVYRAYSISSVPTDNHAIELIIRLVPGGICTTWVFQHLGEGDEVLLNGPYGEFRMTDTGREMVWIAGGSGMAPFWSMVRKMKQDGRLDRKVTYFFGAVNRRDLFFTDEFRALEKEMPNLRYVPALSGEGLDGWDGEKGLITEVVARHIGDGAEKEGYLCGSGGMINAAVKVLVAKGVPKDRIYYDSFT